MKDSLTILFAFLLITKICYGQINFIDSTSHWHEESKGGWVIADTIFIQEYVYYINGDSSLNSMTYFQLFKIGTDSAVHTLNGGYTISTFNQFMGLLREDSNKVYFIPYSSTYEHILYDFNISLGDTLPYSYGFPNCSSGSIYSTDTFYFGGQIRERLFVGALSNIGQVRIFQGIGANSGLLGSMCMAYDGLTTCLKGYYNSIDTIQFTNCSDIIFTNQYDNITKQVIDFKVFPNPSKNNLYMRYFIGNNENLTITVTNMLGQDVLNNKPLNIYGADVLNVSMLSNGIYFLKIQQNGQHLETKKFLIEN